MSVNLGYFQLKHRLHNLPGVIDIKRLFQRNKLLYYLESVLLPITWASQQHKYLKHGGREPVASKKNDAGASCPKFHRAT